MRSQRHLREIQGYDSAGQSEAGGGLVTNPGAVSFAGTVPDQVGNDTVPFSLALAGYFGGNDLPFVYTLSAGTLPSGLALGSATGAITGTPDTVETQAGITITCTDASTDTAVTNAFEIDILA